MNRLTAIFILSILTVSAATAVEKADERDPFFPTGNRPAVQKQSPEADWGRDPFANPLSGRPQVGTAKRGQPHSARLTGIIYSKKVRIAIIGGEIVREGGMVSGKRLVDIRRKSVVLMDEAGRYEEIFLEDFGIGR